MSGEKLYHVGEQVPQTGLYRVFHYQHRLPHDVVMLKGELCPACHKCGERVLFKLSSTAEPLAMDHDFMEHAA